MKRPVPHKCLNCKKFFLSDARNLRHQKYCSQKACQQVSRRASHAKWRASPNGRDYFKGSAHVMRVQAWREKRRKDALANEAVLQDDCQSEVADRQSDSGCAVVLQDDCLDQNPLIIGLISQVSGVLQDHIELVVKELHSKGQMILGKGPGIVRQN